MTSDDFFWRLTVACGNVGEALLLWWLAAVRSDEVPYRSGGHAIARLFGLAVNQRTLLRAAETLRLQGAVRFRTAKNAPTAFELVSDELRSRLGQNVSAPSGWALRHFDPARDGLIQSLPMPTALARVCMLRGNREEAVLLAWLHQAGAALDPIQVSSRQMSEMLLGLIDRRTAMRAMARLQADGLVAVTPLGRAGTQYRLDGGALATLLSSFPFESSTAAIMPGWADLKFPLLQRLDAATAEAAPSPEAAPAEACA